MSMKNISFFIKKKEKNIISPLSVIKESFYFCIYILRIYCYERDER